MCNKQKINYKYNQQVDKIQGFWQEQETCLGLA